MCGHEIHLIINKSGGSTSWVTKEWDSDDFQMTPMWAYESMAWGVNNSSRINDSLMSTTDSYLKKLFGWEASKLNGMSCCHNPLLLTMLQTKCLFRFLDNVENIPFSTVELGELHLTKVLTFRNRQSCSHSHFMQQLTHLQPCATPWIPKKREVKVFSLSLFILSTSRLQRRADDTELSSLWWWVFVPSSSVDILIGTQLLYEYIIAYWSHRKPPSKVKVSSPNYSWLFRSWMTLDIYDRGKVKGTKIMAQLDTGLPLTLWVCHHPVCVCPELKNHRNQGWSGSGLVQGLASLTNLIIYHAHVSAHMRSSSLSPEEVC